MNLDISPWLQKYMINDSNINKRLGFRQSIIHYGKFPIHIACIEKNKPLIQNLLKLGSQIDVYTYIERRNLFHYCCIGNLDLVKTIFSEKTKNLLFIQDKKGMTPLDLAIHYNKMDILLFFIQEGLFLDNELLITYLFRLETINEFILTPIQKNKFKLIINNILYQCLLKINIYFKYNIYILPLFHDEHLYLSYLSGIEGLKVIITDYLDFNIQKTTYILNFVTIVSKLLLK